MSFFRRPLNYTIAEVRPPQSADRAAIEHLLQEAEFQFLSLTDAELPALFDQPLGAVLLMDRTPMGVLLAGLSLHPISWIRAVALDGRLHFDKALPRLIDIFHREAAACGLRQVFFVGDFWSANWLQPHLHAAGYIRDDEVITYEKRRWDTPDRGNSAVSLRLAHPSDLPIITSIDRAAFDAKWVKMAPLLERALQNSALFLVAELAGHPIGYTFTTLHYAGRLAHLVRIAIAPEYHRQGIGVRLLAEVIDFCCLQHVEVLSLNTQASNVRARRLYEWFGFKATGDHQVVLRHDIP